VLLQHLAGTQNTGPGPSWLPATSTPLRRSRSRITRSSDNVAIYQARQAQVLRRSTSTVPVDLSPDRFLRGSKPALQANPSMHQHLVLSPSPVPWSITLSPHVPPPLTYVWLFSGRISKPGKVSPLTRLLVLPTHPLHHQYNPCRGSSIGRACGSYDSKEINLKVVGSSPTFGYSYIKALQGSCSFAFCSFFCLPDVLIPPPAYTELLVP
jgi:hypothetical protein